MTDYVDLAIKYGGYTSLDRVYLTNLKHDPEELRLRDYASPSVINAYFAELYQRRAPRRPWIIFGPELGI